MRFALRVFALLAISSNAVEAQALSSLTQRVVKVGDHAVQVWSGGPADSTVPLVVFENGWNSRAQVWSRVAPEVAKFARVLLYHRGGTGRSEWDGKLPTGDHAARRLRETLDTLGLKAPYVLVGHSFGGPLIRTHAALYPNAVAGLVYVDPSSPCMMKSAFRTAGYDTVHFAALQQQERDATGTRLSDVLQAEKPVTDSLRDVPVVLLLGMKLPGAPPPPVQAWMQARGIDPAKLVRAGNAHKVPCLTSLALEVPRGTMVVTPFSGHAISQDEPELVVWAIRRVLTAITDSAAKTAETPGR